MLVARFFTNRADNPLEGRFPSQTWNTTWKPLHRKAINSALARDAVAGIVRALFPARAAVKMNINLNF